MMEMLRNNNREEYIERLPKDTHDVFVKSGLDFICTELDPAADLSGKIYKDVTVTSWTEVDAETGSWAKFVYNESSDTAHEIDSLEKQGDEYDEIEKHLDTMEKRGFELDDSLFDSTRYMVEHAGNEMFLMAKVPNLIPSGRSWYTKFMEMMYVEPEFAERLCNDYLQYGLAAAKKYADLGLDCVMIASDWAGSTGPLFPPDMIRKYLIPQIITICEYCNSRNMLVLKHTDGNIMQFADDFFAMGIDGYQSIEPYAGMDIGFIKQRYGDKVLLMGNIDCARTLPYGTKEEVIKETLACMKSASRGGGHIVSSANTIGYPTPAENFLAMVDTVHKYGNYPLSF